MAKRRGFLDFAKNDESLSKLADRHKLLPAVLDAEADAEQPQFGLPKWNDRMAKAWRSRGCCAREVGDLCDVDAAVDLIGGTSDAIPVQSREACGKGQLVTDRPHCLAVDFRNLRELIAAAGADIRRQGQKSAHGGGCRTAWHGTYLAA